MVSNSTPSTWTNATIEIFSTTRSDTPTNEVTKRTTTSKSILYYSTPNAANKTEPQIPVSRTIIQESNEDLIKTMKTSHVVTHKTTEISTATINICKKILFKQII